jgi:general secretion pathway protein B
MSSILKALKKLENDRSISKPNHMKIDEKILQNSSSARFSRTSVTVIALALFVCGSGATYVYLKRSASDAAAPQPAPSRAESGSWPANSEVIPPVLNSGTLTKSSAAPKLSPKLATVSETKAGLPKDLSKSESRSQSIKPAATIPAGEPKTVTTSPALPAVVSRPILTVNGIAFQDGGNDNLAVINGITVSGGNMIEGVLVEDIQKDRVRFSHNGEKFDIILNKTNR